MSSGRHESAWFVYRLEGADETLYVGMTSLFGLRMQNHYAADYGDQIVSVSTERYATEAEAAPREAELIRDLSPLLNRAGVTVKDPTPQRGVCAKCGDPTLQARQAACDRCIRNAYRAYVTTDATLHALGDEYGLTRERMRQRFEKIAGHKGLATALKRAHRQERAALLAEIEIQREWVRAERDDARCATCGHLHVRRTRAGWARTCSSDCAEAWAEVRYFFEADVHQTRIASWTVRNPDRVSDTRVRDAARAMTGQGPSYEGAWENRRRRWLVPGSRRFEIAVRAYREGWPAFESWPEEIRRQVRDHVDAEVAA